jgi:hypothetical protein
MSQNKEELGKKLLGSYRTLLERNSLVPEDVNALIEINLIYKMVFLILINRV